MGLWLAQGRDQTSNLPLTLNCFVANSIILAMECDKSGTLPEFSLESDSESDVSEDSDAFSGRLGSCAISIGVSLYSGLLPIKKETTKNGTFRRWKLFTFPAENHSQLCETSFTPFSRILINSLRPKPQSILMISKPIHRPKNTVVKIGVFSLCHLTKKKRLLLTLLNGKYFYLVTVPYGTNLKIWHFHQSKRLIYLST